MTIEYSKYNRIFAFGCSFTNYIYPTWADIIASEAPGAELYNFGRAGAGNLFIAARLAEANQRYNFCETDLVLVMYTTVFREDRWIDNKWQPQGCIYHQEFYDKNFVKKYVDPTGCIIRDLALVELSYMYVQSLPCDSILLKAAPIEDEHKGYDEHTFNIVTDTYKSSAWNKMPTSLKEITFPVHWEITLEGEHDNGGKWKDSHPLTSHYYSYLQHIGIPLTEKSAKFVSVASEKLSNIRYYISDFEDAFPSLFRDDTLKRNQQLL